MYLVMYSFIINLNCKVQYKVIFAEFCIYLCHSDIFELQKNSQCELIARCKIRSVRIVR